MIFWNNEFFESPSFWNRLLTLHSNSWWLLYIATQHRSNENEQTTFRKGNHPSRKDPPPPSLLHLSNRKPYHPQSSSNTVPRFPRFQKYLIGEAGRPTPPKNGTESINQKSFNKKAKHGIACASYNRGAGLGRGWEQYEFSNTWWVKATSVRRRGRGWAKCCGIHQSKQAIRI